MSKVKFKTGQSVIVRNCTTAWTVDLFSYYEDVTNSPYVCTGHCKYDFCLPFNEETANMVGTYTDPPVDESTRFKCGQWVEIDMIGEDRRRALYLKFLEDAGDKCHHIYEPEHRKTAYFVEPHRIHEIKE